MPYNLFKRSEKKGSGLDIFVPGGGRTRRTVAKVPGILATTRLHHDTRTLAGSSIHSPSHTTLHSYPGISIAYVWLSHEYGVWRTLNFGLSIGKPFLR